MTLDEIAYNLLNLVRGGRSNQDEHISLDQIKFNIKHYRAMFLRRDFAKSGFNSRHVEQDLGCVKISKVDASKCCDLPSTCNVYKTDLSIPRTVRYNFREAFTYIGDITGTGRIPLVEPNTVQFLPYDKYTKDKYKAYMIEDFLYIYNADGLEFVNVRGVFEDPSEVSKFSCCGPDCTNCFNDDTDAFPISMDMLALINQGILNGELRLLASTVSDTANDRMQDPQSIKGVGMAPQQQQE